MWLWGGLIRTRFYHNVAANGALGWVEPNHFYHIVAVNAAFGWVEPFP